ncbi:hypothetical protein OHA77_09380 [Streptosporangium sp. NBC_01639]|uniref:hypothetical protein n=1 Tax=Streptosporangium sp. NBC_01639 TaxID=2975948 RepID=UPI003864B479|nr:hypothetical protein OHA77_09380 [Streptosporangium sp. NBC_01639]
MLLASENIVCRRLSCDLKNLLVALAHHAVVGVHHQSGERRVAAAMSLPNHLAQNTSDPVVEQNPGTDTGALLNLLGKLLVGDDRVIRMCHTNEQGVGLTGPDLSGLRCRHGGVVRYAPIAMLRHV